MLDEILTYRTHHRVFLLASHTPTTKHLENENYSEREIQEIIDLLETMGITGGRDGCTSGL